MHKLLRYAKNVLRYAAIITLCVVITLCGVTDIHALTVANVSLLAAEQYHATVVTSGHIYIAPNRWHLHYIKNYVTP